MEQVIFVFITVLITVWATDLVMEVLYDLGIYDPYEVSIEETFKGSNGELGLDSYSILFEEVERAGLEVTRIQVGEEGVQVFVDEDMGWLLDDIEEAMEQVAIAVEAIR